MSRRRMVVCGYLPHWFLLMLLSIFLNGNHPYGSAVGDADTIDVGVILNLDSTHGLVTNASIAMGHRDFYASPSSSTAHARTIVLHVRNSRNSPLEAASAALDLISSVKVKALIASDTDQVAPDQLVAQVANQAKVPLIALSPVLTMSSYIPQASYLLDMDLRDSSQAKAISSLIKAQPWNNVTLLYDDDTSSFILSLIAALEDNGIVPFTHLVDDSRWDVSRTLKQLAATKVGVYVIHVSFSLAATFFKQAHTMGMMSEGRVWIVTARVGNLLSYLEPSVIEEGMQGVLVMRSQLPNTEAGKKKLHERLIKADCNVCGGGMDIYSLWAYDAMRLLAEAAEKTYISRGQQSKESENQLMDSIIFSARGISISRSAGPNDHQRVAMADSFAIVKIVGKSWRRVGYWTPDCSFCLQNWRPKKYPHGVKRRNLLMDGKKLVRVVQRLEDGLAASATNVLNILVPNKTGFYEFVNRDNRTGKFGGFAIELFNNATKDLTWETNYTMYSEADLRDGYYDRLVDLVARGEYDALVGDVTITAERSRTVDFSQPYLRSDIVMVVQAVDERHTRGPFWFLEPLSKNLWLATFALLFLRGILLWIFEGQRNPSFMAVSKVDHLKKIFSFSFTVSVFSETERLQSQYSKLINTLWMVILFMLAAGYNSTLTSMLTVDSLRPKVTDLGALIANNETIGYQKGAFLDHFLLQRGAHPQQLRSYSTVEEYAKALRDGPHKNGCVAIVDELPYVRVFLKHYPDFIIANYYDRTGGFGYVFGKGSKWVSPVSEAVLNITQSPLMCDLQREVFVNDSSCGSEPKIPTVSYTKLTLASFKYPYLFVASISVFLLVAFLLQLFFPLAIQARNYDTTSGRVDICEHDTIFEMASIRRTPPSATRAFRRVSTF